MISVIVPVYQAEKAITRCVESILSQTYSDLEVLLINDGSTDGSGAICDAYAKKDIRVKVIHKQNAGVSSARNTGISMATGEYLQFVDSDDYLETTCCETLWRAVEKTGAKLALCGFHHWYYGRDVRKVPVMEGILRLDEGEALLDLYDQGYLNMPWNKLFCRDAIGQGFEESLSLGEDFLFNLAYMKPLTELVLVTEPLYHYIQGSTATTLSTRKREDKLQISLRIQAEMKKFFAEKVGREPKRPVIEERFLREVLDEIEALPMEKSSSFTEKRERIAAYSKLPEIVEAGKKVTFRQIDCRILFWFMKQHASLIVLCLAYLRAWLINLLRPEL